MALNSKQQMFWTNEKRKLSALKPWERNPRQIKDKQAKLLAESFSDFGQVETIAISANGDIYNGHQRLSVLAGKYGMDYEVDVRVSSRDLTEKERERLTVYLHRGATGEWDFDELANWDMSDLLTWGFEESDFPFDVAPATNEGADAEPQIDKAEELRQKWDVQSGQMWQLGEHRIICGDCTDRAVVERVMDGEKADLMFTSPPYNNSSGGMKYDYSGDSKRFYKDESMDKKSLSEWLQLCDNTILRFSENCKNEESPAVWNVMYNANMRNGYGLSMFSGKHGMTVKETICWDKSTGFPTATKGILSRNWELVFVLSMGDSYFTTQGKNEVRYAKWDISNTNSQSTEHHAAFPIELPEMAIRWFSPDAAIVYEPFSGSGTTLIACENLSRKARAVEISPAYVAVAIQRWVDVTGKEPILLDA